MNRISVKTLQIDPKPILELPVRNAGNLAIDTKGMNIYWANQKGYLSVASISNSSNTRRLIKGEFYSIVLDQEKRSVEINN